MTPNALTSSRPTVHQRYRQLLRAGFTAQEAAALIARADGIDRHAEGELPNQSAWRWQEIARLEFLRFLVDSGRLRDLPASTTGAHETRRLIPRSSAGAPRPARGAEPASEGHPRFAGYGQSSR
jgi:hypothetical protein